MTEQETKAVLALFGLESLEDAKRENWPWWRKDGRHSRNPHDWDKPEGPKMPDFPTDPAASVRLAEKISDELGAFGIWPPTVATDLHRRWGISWWNGKVYAETLGAALLAALVAAREE